MNAQSPVPENDPLMISWNKYKATEEYANTRRWAATEHVDGSLWAAFSDGWIAGRAALGEGKTP